MSAQQPAIYQGLEQDKQGSPEKTNVLWLWEVGNPNTPYRREQTKQRAAKPDWALRLLSFNLSREKQISEIRLPTDEQAIRQGYYYDEAAALDIIQFAETYVCPQFVQGHLHLLDWQRDYLSCLYGWRHKETKAKRFNRSLLHIAKKNGKTLLVSVCCLYELYRSDCQSPIVISASTSVKNAKQVFLELAHSIRKSKDKLFKVSKILESSKTIKYPAKNARYFAISADAPSSEGENATYVCVDEVHAHRSEKLYRSLEYSQIARQGFGSMVMISTSGNDLCHFYYDIYSKAKRVANGQDKDIHFLPVLYEIPNPETADLENPAVWRLANPSMDVSFTQEQFHADLQAAKCDTASFMSFKRYRLNLWQSGTDTPAIDLIQYDNCAGLVDEDTLRQAPCYLGVDLSMSTDPTSISAVFALPDNRFAVKSWAFVCDEGVRRRDKSNLPRYNQFIENGYMTTTEGDMIDTSKVKEKIMALAEIYQVRCVCFDQWSCYVLAAEVQAEGVNTFRSPMTAKYMSEPFKELSRAIGERRLIHDGNTWLRWCANNLRIETDNYGGVRPDKKREKDKTDGIIAAILAFGSALREQVESLPVKSIYDERGVEFLPDPF